MQIVSYQLSEGFVPLIDCPLLLPVVERLQEGRPSRVQDFLLACPEVAWDVRRQHFFLQQVVPSETLEVLVSFDLLESNFFTSFLGVSGEDKLDDAFGLGVDDKFGEVEFGLVDDSVESVGIVDNIFSER